MARIRAALFDWRGTLVHDPPAEWWVTEALTRTGRSAPADVVASICHDIEVAAALDEAIELERTIDTSVEVHRTNSFRFFALAGLDPELAESLYAIDFDPAAHVFYPDVLPTFVALHDRECKIAIVSDIHVDLRPEFVAAGLDPYVDAYVLSFEHGVQKPDRAMFDLALRMVDVPAAEALMVGDRASHDGGGVKAGIATLLVSPPATAHEPNGLDRVVRLVG